jgi:hypothetical protein
MNLCECELPEKTLRKVGNDIVLQSVAGIFLFLGFFSKYRGWTVGFACLLPGWPLVIRAHFCLFARSFFFV